MEKKSKWKTKKKGEEKEIKHRPKAEAVVLFFFL